MTTTVAAAGSLVSDDVMVVMRSSLSSSADAPDYTHKLATARIAADLASFNLVVGSSVLAGLTRDL